VRGARCCRASAAGAATATGLRFAGALQRRVWGCESCRPAAGAGPPAAPHAPSPAPPRNRDKTPPPWARYDAAAQELVNDDLGVAYPIIGGIPRLVPSDGRILDGGGGGGGTAGAGGGGGGMAAGGGGGAAAGAS
jgi:uncharacterized protein YbaR (Trm112 family)